VKKKSGLKYKIIKFLNRLPYVKFLKSKISYYESNMQVPPGHFYSSVNSIEWIKENQEKIFKKIPDSIPGIELNESHQQELLKEFIKYYAEFNFSNKPSDKNRYYLDNGFFLYSDAFFLFSMLKYYKPQRIIEIGSGFSSALMLDVNDKILHNSIDFTFIEPFQSRLKKILRTNDKYILIEKPIQEIENEVFHELKKNDILFVDSSHVVKAGSDVQDILFRILPILNKGVLIHFHDILYPFQYSKNMLIDKKIDWNESYFLRAFLMYNNKYSIELFNSYLSFKYSSLFKQYMPFCTEVIGGSLWLRKNEDR
jgi:predicted O-methyltransferase YrrM